MRTIVAVSVLLVHAIAWADPAPVGAAEPGMRSGPPGRWELRLSPTNPGSLGSVNIGGTSGLSLILPESGDSIKSFGVNAGVGYLLTPMLEPGAVLEVNVVSANGTLSTIGFLAFLKLNFWMARKLNFFLEPFAGFLLVDVNRSTTFFRTGFRAGLEYLFAGNWGVSLWTGLGALIESSYLLEIPFRWGVVGYF